jgi:hypothetical protein
MIEPSSINPLTLPSVPLENRKQLPETPSIYFAIDSLGTIQYIGRSKNLKQRWAGHHHFSDLNKIGGVKIAWLEVSDESLLDSIEEALIGYFEPPLNNGVFYTIDGKFAVKGAFPLGKRISVRLPKPVEEKLEAIATQKGVSLSEMLRWVVVDSLMGEGKYLELIGEDSKDD